MRQYRLGLGEPRPQYAGLLFRRHYRRRILLQRRLGDLQF
jgi:hypothetical protein